MMTLKRRGSLTAVRGATKALRWAIRPVLLAAPATPVIAVSHSHPGRARHLTTRSAACSGLSCSHTRTIVQPAALNRSSVSRSRLTFAANLPSQNSRFRTGVVAWAGAPVPIPHEDATYTREQTASPLAGWLSFQPLWQDICRTDPDLFD